MNIDTPGSTAATVLPSDNNDCATSKNKAVSKRVGLSRSPLFLLTLRRALQVSEKRSEVRMLDYTDVPGMTNSSCLSRAQKYVSSAKKQRVHHLAPCPADQGLSKFLIW
jgi:hypothetical protein